MRSFPLTILALAMLPFAISCKKDSNGGGGGNSATQVVIDLPTNNQIVLNGSVLKVEGTVTDNDIIGNVSVQIRNKGTGAVLYSAQASTASVTFYRYTFNWSVSGVTNPLVATVKVTGRDVNGGEAFKEVDVNLEP